MGITAKTPRAPRGRNLLLDLAPLASLRFYSASLRSRVSSRRRSASLAPCPLPLVPCLQRRDFILQRLYQFNHVGLRLIAGREFGLEPFDHLFKTVDLNSQHLDFVGGRAARPTRRVDAHANLFDFLARSECDLMLAFMIRAAGGGAILAAIDLSNRLFGRDRAAA